MRKFVGALVVVGLLGAGGCHWLMARGQEAVDQAADAEAEAHAHYLHAMDGRQLSYAFASYAREHGGRLPPAGRVKPELTQEDYLIGNRWPKDRWVDGPATLVELTVPADDPLLDARPPLEPGAWEYPPGRGMAPAAFFARFPEAARRGTLVLAAAPDRKRWTVLAVGARAGRPNVVYGPESMLDPAFRPTIDERKNRPGG